MSLTLDNTNGGSSSNSYCSLATAGLFLEENIHIYATWAALSTTDREACLIYATSLLDVQMSWVGWKTTEAQKLEWPREDVYDRSEYSVDSSSIPEDIQRGTAFYAYYLSQEDRIDENDTLGYKYLKAGSLAMEIDKYDRKGVMPSIIYDMIKWYGRKSSGQARVLERR